MVRARIPTNIWLLRTWQSYRAWKVSLCPVSPCPWTRKQYSRVISGYDTPNIATAFQYGFDLLCDWTLTVWILFAEYQELNVRRLKHSCSHYTVSIGFIIVPFDIFEHWWREDEDVIIAVDLIKFNSKIISNIRECMVCCNCIFPPFAITTHW